MLSLITRKLFRIFANLVGVSLIVFIMAHAIPGNPWSNYSTSRRIMMNTAADSPILRQLHRRFGLDLPLWRQYIRYVFVDINPDGTLFCGAICGNLGPSIIQSGRPVTDVIFGNIGGDFWKSQMGYSLRLVLLGTLLTVGLGIPLGILAALRPKSLLGRLISLLTAALMSIPNFIIGLLAIIILASWLKIINVLPDWNRPIDWLVPGLVLAAMPMAAISRITRETFLNTLGEDYVRTARAKGLNERQVIIFHVLRNAAVPILISLGPAIMEMFVGLFIIENLYSFPGMGKLYWYAVVELDYPLILGLTLVYAIFIILINTLTEILAEAIDPRIRHTKKEAAA